MEIIRLMGASVRLKINEYRIENRILSAEKLYCGEREEGSG